MPGRAVPPSRPQAGTNCECNMRTHLSMIWPALNGDDEDPANHNRAGLRQEHLQNYGPVRNAVVDPGTAHVVPGPGIINPAAPNVPLQIDEQEDLHAMRTVLKLPLRNNAITATHFRMAFTKLSAVLPTQGPYRVPEFQAEYARILRRMARVMTPCSENEEYDDSTMAVLLQELAVECPMGLGECLDRLMEAMSVAFSLMRGRGADGVFVAVRDREAFASALHSLATRLHRPL